jgi:hypothetical protein
MSVEFYIYVVLLVWIIVEVRVARKEAKKAAETTEQTRKEVEDLRAKMLPSSKPLPYYDAMMRQKERTRQFLLERARQQSQELPLNDPK